MRVYDRLQCCPAWEKAHVASGSELEINPDLHSSDPDFKPSRAQRGLGQWLTGPLCWLVKEQSAACIQSGAGIGTQPPLWTHLLVLCGSAAESTVPLEVSRSLLSNAHLSFLPGDSRKCKAPISCIADPANTLLSLAPQSSNAAAAHQ